MKRYTREEIEALTNWDGMLCKPPHKNNAEKKQYYARYIDRMLWRYFSPEDWQEISRILDDIKVNPKLKETTQFLITRRLNNHS